MHHRGPLLAIVVAACALAFGAACGAGESSDSGAAETPDGGESPAPAGTAGTLTNDRGWPRVEGLRGDRYCEVLLARIIDGRLNAEVWNTYGLSECPEAEWKALDTEAIKTERGVIAALLNGPRYWLMDAIEKKPSGERQETTFGAIEMFRAATVDLGPIPPNLAPYIERLVARETVFEWAKGAEVYQLTSADGGVYLMQSYSVQRDAALTESDLSSLGERLTLPAGWTYSVRTLDETFRLEASGQAAVIQDDLSNTYQRIDAE